MSEERLMKTPEEVKQKARELLQMSKEEVLTKYMFQEQENERLHSIIKEAREETEKQLKGAICQEFTDLKVILRILDKGKNNECRTQKKIYNR